MGWEEWRPRSLEHYHDTGAHTFPIHSKQKRETEEKREIKTNEEDIEGQEVDWRREEDHLKETRCQTEEIRRRSQKIFWSEDYDE